MRCNKCDAIGVAIMQQTARDCAMQSVTKGARNSLQFAPQSDARIRWLFDSRVVNINRVTVVCIVDVIGLVKIAFVAFTLFINLSRTHPLALASVYDYPRLSVCLNLMQSNQPHLSEAKFMRARVKLTAELRRRGIRNPSVLDAIKRTPRHLFIDQAQAARAYDDVALPIECGQTISQPFIVALMSAMLLGGARPVHRALEIGTGCGYQSAVLARLVERVFSVERIGALHTKAKTLFAQLKLNNIRCRYGDGFFGWREHQPYDGILVTAAPREVPPQLIAQLAPNARLVIPVGDELQRLRIITRTVDGVDQQYCDAVRFVPMRGGAVK